MHNAPQRIPGIVIGGTGSNTGKTTVTLALLCALASRGLAVRAAKTGPDYIDAAFHAAITGQPAANLDTWMCRQAPATPAEKPVTGGKGLPRGLQTIFERMAASPSGTGRGPDLLLVEGAMGLYDGGHAGAGSTAHLAALLDLPILLVCSAAGLGESVAALVEGYLRHKPQWLAKSTPPRFLGIVCTHIGSPRHAEIIADALKPLEKSDNVPLLGLLPRKGAPELQSRHLGLVEAREALPALDRAALTNWLEDHCRLDALLKRAGVVNSPSRGMASGSPKKTDANSACLRENVREHVREGKHGDMCEGKGEDYCNAITTATAKRSLHVRAPGGAASALTGNQSGNARPATARRAIAAPPAAMPEAPLASRFFPPCQPDAATIRNSAIQAGNQELQQDTTSLFAPGLATVAPAKVRLARGTPRPLIAMAWDAAFSFCYADLPALLTELGADVVPFSPLRDAAPPQGCTGLYFPGGYPELHAEELGANLPMVRHLRALAQKNLPIYGECGGYIYLMRSLRLEGQPEPQEYAMAGLLPLHCVLGKTRAALGYRAALALPGWPERAERLKTPVTGQPGSKPLWVRGHEFHYASEDDGPLPPRCAPLWQLHDSKGILLRQEGCRCGSVAGTWLHCYPEGSRTFWRAWLKMATPLP
jgi:cobyrinic acid a,c-diamide synthase